MQSNLPVPSYNSPVHTAASALDRKFAGKLTAWHRHHGRHDLPWQGTRDPYRIWVSEIMLQQTQVGAVTGYYQRFMDRFPDLQALAVASEDDVLRLWSGLGYYARARNLHKAALRIVGSHGGQFPRCAEDIAKLPGIGRSTAAAIAVFAYGERAAILDGNVKRVLARRFGIVGFPGVAAIEAQLWGMASALLPGKSDAARIETYTQALMDLGATVCTRSSPACDRCPLAAECVARRSGQISKLPSPRPKRRIPTRQTTWLVLHHRGNVLLERRPSMGLWGGLLVFPEFAGRDLARHCAIEFSCVLAGHRPLTPFVHGFTHFRLEIAPLLCEVKKREAHAESSGRTWLDIDAAIAAAVPVAVRKILRSL